MKRRDETKMKRRGVAYLHHDSAALLLLLLVVTCYGVVAGAEANSEILHLYPETPRHDERLRCGVTQLYRVHDLVPSKIYDVKVSYPASIPTDFILEVDQVLLPASLLVAAAAAGDGGDGNGVASTMPVRRLNTAKLRLHPQELLVGALRKHQHDQDTKYKSQTYRLGLLNNGVAAANELLREQVTLDISLRAEVEGVSPVIDPLTRECVFDIVVEEMLFGGAFPYDTLVLIAWLVLLLLLALKWVYPYMLRKIALELPEECLHASGGSGGNIKRS